MKELFPLAAAAGARHTPAGTLQEKLNGFPELRAVDFSAQELNFDPALLRQSIGEHYRSFLSYSIEEPRRLYQKNCRRSMDLFSILYFVGIL